MATGKAEGSTVGRADGRKGMAKGAQGQAIVHGKAEARAGRGGYREREGRRIGRRWQSKEMFEGRASQTGAGQRSGVKMRTIMTGSEFSAGRHERQVKVKVDA